MPWLRIAFDHAKIHVMPFSLATQLIADMVARDCQIENVEATLGRAHAKKIGGNPRPITEWSFDLGGSCYAHEPRADILVDGLSIRVPCIQWHANLTSLRRCQVRAFADGSSYFKHHHWHFATVLTIRQHREAIDQLEAGRVEALARAQEFGDELEAMRAKRAEAEQCAR